MKIIHITDTHLTPVGSRHRVDDYEDAIFAKLEHVARRAQELGVYLIAHTGDVFDVRGVRGVPRELVVRFGDFLSSYPCLTWVLLMGQHDCRGREPATARYSPLSLLKWHPNAVVVSQHTVTLEFEGEEVVAVPFHTSVRDTLAQLSLGNRSIVLTHAPISDVALPFEYIRQEDLLTIGAGMILSGDIHSGFAPRRVRQITSLIGVGGSTVFSNPGALARTTIRDATRQPQLAVVDTEVGEVYYEPVPCEPNVFELDPTLLLRRRHRSAFAERLKSLTFSTDMSWESLMRGVKETDKETIAAARNYYEATIQP